MSKKNTQILSPPAILEDDELSSEVSSDSESDEAKKYSRPIPSQSTISSPSKRPVCRTTITSAASRSRMLKKEEEKPTTTIPATLVNLPFGLPPSVMMNKPNTERPANITSHVDSLPPPPKKQEQFETGAHSDGPTPKKETSPALKPRQDKINADESWADESWALLWAARRLEPAADESRKAGESVDDCDADEDSDADDDSYDDDQSSDPFSHLDKKKQISVIRLDIHHTFHCEEFITAVVALARITARQQVKHPLVKAWNCAMQCVTLVGMLFLLYMVFGTYIPASAMMKMRDASRMYMGWDLD
jgi:hypothetical protein